MKRHVEARKFLGRGFELYRDIQIKKEQAASIRASLDNSTVSLNNERVLTTRNVSAMEDSIIRIIQLEEDIRKETSRLAIIQREAVEMINQLDNLTMRSMLTKYYICFKSWDTIRSELNLSRKYSSNMHTMALRQIEDILKSFDPKSATDEVKKNE
jgi:hypothetical protein